MGNEARVAIAIVVDTNCHVLNRPANTRPKAKGALAAFPVPKAALSRPPAPSTAASSSMDTPVPVSPYLVPAPTSSVPVPPVPILPVPTSTSPPYVMQKSRPAVAPTSIPIGVSPAMLPLFHAEWGMPVARGSAAFMRASLPQNMQPETWIGANEFRALDAEETLEESTTLKTTHGLFFWSMRCFCFVNHPSSVHPNPLARTSRRGRPIVLAPLLLPHRPSLAEAQIGPHT